MTSDDKTGFCIPYTVRKTADKGRGVFANAPIRKGTLLWRHVRGLFAVYDEPALKKRLADLPHKEVIYELTHMYGLAEFSGCVIRIFDDGVLINHSRHPSVEINDVYAMHELELQQAPRKVKEVEQALLNDRFALIAARNLEAGDELTMDYNVGIKDPPYYDDLCRQHKVTEPWL
jgi:hypothetical protein